MALVTAEFGELNGVVGQLWTDYPNGSYAFLATIKSVDKALPRADKVPDEVLVITTNRCIKDRGL